MMLTKEEKEVLEFMEDHRYVDETLEKAFLDGCLSEFRKFILEYNTEEKKLEKITALLRGNSNSIIVYYHNHKIWELSVVDGKGRISFNFDHARYSSDWRKKFEELTEEKNEAGKVNEYRFLYPKDSPRSKNIRLSEFPAMKVKINDNDEIIGGTIGDISCDKEHFSHEFVKNNFELVKGLISDFFDTSENHTTDYFKELVNTEYECTGKDNGGTNPLVEKIWQQRLFFEMKELMDGLYVYDLEFSQPFPDKNKVIIPYAKKHGSQYLSITAKGIKEKLKTNSPDMFAIRFQGGKPVSFVMIEVKSTMSACKGRSDIYKHLEGMYAYSKQDIFIRNRKIDAYKTLCQLQKFGFISEDKGIPEIPDDIKIENILLLTNNYSSEEREEDGGAMTYYRENKEKINETAKKYNCQIWLTDDLYIHETIHGLDHNIIE